MIPIIHPLCDVQSLNIGAKTRIWQFCVVLPNAKIGSECNICSHVFIGNDVIVGDRVTIKCGVQLWDGIRIGNDVFVDSNKNLIDDRFLRSRKKLAEFTATTITNGGSNRKQRHDLAGHQHRQWHEDWRVRSGEVGPGQRHCQRQSRGSLWQSAPPQRIHLEPFRPRSTSLAKPPTPDISGRPPEPPSFKPMRSADPLPLT